jgi:hypothetical protein
MQLIDSYHDAFRSFQTEMLYIDDWEPGDQRLEAAARILTALVEHQRTCLRVLSRFLAGQNGAGVARRQGPESEPSTSSDPADRVAALLAALQVTRADLHVALTRTSDEALDKVITTYVSNEQTLEQWVRSVFVEHLARQTRALMERREADIGGSRPPDMREIIALMLEETGPSW